MEKNLRTPSKGSSEDSKIWILLGYLLTSL